MGSNICTQELHDREASTQTSILSYHWLKSRSVMSVTGRNFVVQFERHCEKTCDP